MTQIASCSMAGTILEGVFMNIPTPIITDILARLPPKAAIRCCCVCKTWLKLISEAVFVNLHLSKSPTCLIVLKFSPESPHLSSFNLVEVEDETDHHGVRPIAGTDSGIPRSLNRMNTGMTLIGSIDGLVCISEYAIQYDSIHVWNPTMGEFITVQTPAGVLDFPNVVTCGFGISSGKYLVVRIFQEIEYTDLETYRHSELIRDSFCHVYTIGDGVWKSIGRAPPYLYQSGVPGFFLNGNLHWIIYDKDNSEQICCLDLENELFQPFPSPPKLWNRNSATLNLYKGCLSVCDNSSDLDVVIWVMKEYGVQNSWSKEVVMSKQHLTGGVGYAVAHIIKVFKDGEVLLLWSNVNDKLFLHHPERKTVQYIDVKESMTGPNYHPDGIYPGIETTDYISSIVSLKSLGEVNINRS